MSIEAMKQALEVLEYHIQHFDSEQYTSICELDPAKDAITSLSQAIAEAEKQEPVDSDLLDDARAILEIIVHDQPVDTFSDARALIPQLRARLNLPPIINFTHPKPKPEQEPNAAIVRWNCPCGNTYTFRGMSGAQPKREPLTNENPLLVFAKECVLGAYTEDEIADAAFRAIECAHDIKGVA